MRSIFGRRFACQAVKTPKTGKRHKKPARCGGWGRITPRRGLSAFCFSENAASCGTRAGPARNFLHTFLTEHTGEALSARGKPPRGQRFAPPATQAGRFVPNIGQAALFIGRKAAPWAAYLRLTWPAYAGRKAACIRRQKRGRRARRWLARGISAYLRAVCRTVRRPFDVFEQMRTHAPGPLSDLYGLRRLQNGVMQPRHMRHDAALLFPQPKAALRQRRIQT